MESQGRLTVCFEDPFWIGVFERFEGGKLSVCRVIFGAEPKEYEVYEFILRHYDALQFSPAVDAEVRERAMNPKRMQRAVRKQLQKTGFGTKSREALRLQHEQNKTERRVRGRELREAEEQRKFEIRQQKRKEKHRGR